MNLSVFEESLNALEQGINCDKVVIKRSKLISGRSSDEKRTTVFVRRDNTNLNVMDVTFFSGIKPWYHPWIEIGYPYDFLKKDDDQIFSYFDSSVEKTLLQLFCKNLPPAGKIFVSYEPDDETRKALMMNVPMALSRLGFLLYQNGCTWFKDWYFPEGGFEGGQKLQGEKPLTATDRKRHLTNLKDETSTFLLEKKKQSTLHPFEQKTCRRASILLKGLKD